MEVKIDKMASTCTVTDNVIRRVSDIAVWPLTGKQFRDYNTGQFKILIAEWLVKFPSFSHSRTMTLRSQDRIQAIKFQLD